MKRKNNSQRTIQTTRPKGKKKYVSKEHLQQQMDADQERLLGGSNSEKEKRQL